MYLFAQFNDRAYYTACHKNNNGVGYRAYNNLHGMNI